MISEIKRASLYSNESNKITESKLKEKLKDFEPPDRFYFVHVLFIALGLMHFIPYTFFLTANGYWMYKFRNVSADITDTDARTKLQTRFSPGTTISNIIPVLIFMLGSTIYGHKIKARIRVLGSLITFTMCFIFMTGFIKSNTDSWQLWFFILTMATLGIISGANAVLEIATLAVISKFPQRYMKVYLIGQSFAGIFNSMLQITSLAIGTSTTTSALIYFLVGSTLMAISTTMFYFSKYNKCYNWYVNNMAEDTKKGVISFAAAKSLAKTLWPCIMMYTLVLLTILPTHTAITTLVVSEYYGQGHSWNDIYFVPVITFLYSEVTGLLGRAASSKLNKSVNEYVLTAAMFVRMLIFVPLVYFCNAQPRTHSEVLLPHDWQYIIVLGIFNFTNGYTLNMVFLEVRKSVEPEKIEDAFMVFMSAAAVIGPLLTPLTLLAVELL